MAGLIDWSAINPAPAQPSQALASIPEMLQQFAQRRQKAAEDEQARKQAEAHFQAQMAEKAADDARAEQYHKDELDYQNRTLAGSEAQRRAVAEEGQRKDAAAAYPQIQQLNATDPLQARNLAMLHGGSIEDRPQAPPPAAPPPLWGLPRELGLAMNMGTGDTPQAPMPAPPPPGQQLHLAGRVLELPSAQEMETNRAAQAKQRAQQFATQVGPVAGSPFAKQALAETVAQMQAPTWDAKEDPFKTFQARMQHLEDEQVTREGHHATVAASGATEGHKAVAENQRALRELRGDIASWKTENGVRDLGKAYEEMSKAEKLAGSKSGAAQAAAVEGFIKSARGGAVTGASQNFMTTHMGGLLDGLETRLAAAKKGNYGVGQMASLNQAIRDAKDAIKAGVEERRQAYVDKYYSGQYDDMKANVDNEYAGLFGQFGYKVQRQPGTHGVSITGHGYNERGGPGGLTSTDEDRMKKAGF